jgi:hypothetical protein
MPYRSTKPYREYKEYFLKTETEFIVDKDSETHLTWKVCRREKEGTRETWVGQAREGKGRDKGETRDKGD